MKQMARRSLPSRPLHQSPQQLPPPRPPFRTAPCFEYTWAWIPDATAAAQPTRWWRTSMCLWDMKLAVWDDSLNLQMPCLGHPVNGCMSPYGCIWTRRHPWQPPDKASAQMPWFRSLVALRNRPPIPGVWCPCKQKCPCKSCSDARAQKLGLEIVVESEGADGMARLEMRSELV